jgi:SAM-dependent MidA family methyltransferase
VVKSKLIEAVRRDGPIPFESFMARALYGDEGFFASDQLRSVKAGDFLTSPEVSALFGEAVASFVAAESQRVGSPLAVVEIAAGSGSLARVLVERGLSVDAVEVSPAAREALSTLLGEARVHGSLDGVPNRDRAAIIANELLDNLPMAIAQLTDDGWRERWVGLDGEALCFVDTEARPQVLAWLDRFAGPVEPGGWVEVQLEVFDWITSVVRALDAGTLLLFDYGDTSENLAPRRRDGTLRTYRSHHLGPHPLEEPGATDITADVNFTAAEAAAAEAGAAVEVMRQDDFLAAWGLRDRISELRHRELELARLGDEMERLKVRTMRQEAETLMHPRGLGDFKVLIARK